MNTYCLNNYLKINFDKSEFPRPEKKILDFWNILKEEKYKITIIYNVNEMKSSHIWNQQIPQTKESITWTAKRPGSYFKGHNVHDTSTILLYLLQDSGGYYLINRRDNKHTPASLLETAINYQIPQRIGVVWFSFNLDPIFIVNEKANNYAHSTDLITCAKVVGICGMKYPKVSLKWLADANVDVYYIIKCLTPVNSTFYMITDGDKAIPAKVTQTGSYMHKTYEVDALRGSKVANNKDVNFSQLTKVDNMIIKKAIEFYHTQEPWDGIKL